MTLGVYSVIIKKAIGDIRCLLNFVNDASLFQRVNHTGRQVDEVPFLHGQVPHNFIPSVDGNHFAQLSFIMRILAIDDLGVARGFQKVPRFVFPRGIPQPGGYPGVGVDLEAEIVLGCDEGNDDRKTLVTAAEEFGTLLPQI